VQTKIASPDVARSASSPRLRISIRQAMIAVAGAAVAFAVFGVNHAVTMVLVGFFASTLIARPAVRQDWLLLLTASIAALPFILLAWMYTFAFRAALFLGHWPRFNNPDPSYLPDHFNPHTEFLEFLIPTIVSVALTCVFVAQVMRFAAWPRRLKFALFPATLLWLLAFLLLVGDPAGIMGWILD
jgi:hypothetical protein